MFTKDSVMTIFPAEKPSENKFFYVKLKEPKCSDISKEVTELNVALVVDLRLFRSAAMFDKSCFKRSEFGIILREVTLAASNTIA